MAAAGIAAGAGAVAAGNAGVSGVVTPLRASSETGVERSVLPNGLVVLSERVPGVRSLSLGAWVRSASAHEARAEMGVSHFLEHLCFKGTERRSARDVAAALESLGGSLDAYTSREHISFQARVLDEHLAQAADVIADVMFHPQLRDEDHRLERKVILEEIAMVEDTPDDIVFELHNAELWGAHPYGYTILGTRESVESLGVHDVRALHARAFHPDQVVVAAAGNVTHQALVDALVAAGWGDLKPSGAAQPPVPPATGAAPRYLHVERDSAQAHLVFGSPTVAHADPRRHALIIVDTLLGGGMSSRLFQHVREERGLAYSVYSFQSFLRDAGMHGVYAGTAPESAEETLEAIRAELRRVHREGITAADLAAAKQQIKGQVTLSMESVSSRMYRAAAVELFDDPWKPLDAVLAEVDAVTLETAREVCEAYFDPERQTVVHLGPA